MSPVLDDRLSLAVTRVADLGRRRPPVLPVPLARLSAFTREGAGRLEATCTGMEWQAEPERVVVDPRRNAPATLAALGHLDEAHTCPDCAPAGEARRADA